MKKIAVFLVIGLVLGLAPALALDAPLDEQLAKMADHDSFLVKAPGMMMHGLYSMGEAPLELLNQPYDHMFVKKDYRLGLFKGLNSGASGMLDGFTTGSFNLFRSLVPGMGRYENPNKQNRLVPGLAA